MKETTHGLRISSSGLNMSGSGIKKSRNRWEWAANEWEWVGMEERVYEYALARFNMNPHKPIRYVRRIDT